MLAILAEAALRSLLLGSAVWVGLKFLRLRNPHVHMTCWVMVLVASLAMPLLMHWTTVTISRDSLPMPAPESLWPIGSPSPEPLPASLSPDPAAPPAAHLENDRPVNWFAVATAIYALVAGVLLLRLALGIYLTWLLVRAAKPMREPWTADWCVRVSDAIGGPVTFGSTILLPPQCSDWDWRKRQAVLAHEGAHVINRDFYVLLLASLNRALFWFSPFAWWHLVRLAELAEIISDTQALEVLEDRLSYAEFCLISCNAFAARRRAWKWRGRARFARASSASSPPPRRQRGSIGGNESGSRQPSCRRSSLLPAVSPTPPRRYPRGRLTAIRLRRTRCACRKPWRFTHSAGPRSSPFSAKAKISSVK